MALGADVEGIFDVARHEPKVRRIEALFGVFDEGRAGVDCDDSGGACASDEGGSVAGAAAKVENALALDEGSDPSISRKPVVPICEMGQ